MDYSKEQPAPEQIDAIIKIYGGWKGDFLARLRTIVTETNPDIIEEVKWQTPSRPEGLPVWSLGGILCIAEIWKDNIKLIFFKGTQISDPEELFNSRLKSKSDRAIELREGDTIDEAALQGLVREAIRLNSSKT